jgi:hypothetical protein
LRDDKDDDEVRFAFSNHSLSTSGTLCPIALCCIRCLEMIFISIFLTDIY